MAVIDIGPGASDLNSYQLAGLTSVSMDNPANETGRITSIEIWVNENLEGCKIGTFYVVSGNNLSARDYETIGNLAAGYNKFAVDINVESGDYIGVYHTGGRIEKQTTAGTGYWYVGDDQMSCSNKTFSTNTNQISLYGTGTTEVPPPEVDNAIFFGINF